MAANPYELHRQGFDSKKLSNLENSQDKATLRKILLRQPVPTEYGLRPVLAPSELAALFEEDSRFHVTRPTKEVPTTTVLYSIDEDETHFGGGKVNVDIQTTFNQNGLQEEVRVIRHLPEDGIGVPREVFSRYTYHDVNKVPDETGQLRDHYPLKTVKNFAVTDGGSSEVPLDEIHYSEDGSRIESRVDNASYLNLFGKLYPFPHQPFQVSLIQLQQDFAHIPGMKITLKDDKNGTVQFGMFARGEAVLGFVTNMDMRTFEIVDGKTVSLHTENLPIGAGEDTSREPGNVTQFFYDGNVVTQTLASQSIGNMEMTTTNIYGEDRTLRRSIQQYIEPGQTTSIVYDAQGNEIGRNRVR